MSHVRFGSSRPRTTPAAAPGRDSSTPNYGPAATVQMPLRVGEDVATLTPHRPGCADFPLPVLHGRASLTDGVADTIRDSPGCRRARGRQGPTIRVDQGRGQSALYRHLVATRPGQGQ